jgi:rod shape-determining protein MreD
MMNIAFFGAVGLGLMVMQTIVLPAFAWFPYCFDLPIILVLYLSMVFPSTGTIAAISFIGMVMDSLSGVPFFFHVFSYCWVYILVQLFKQVIFQRSILFIVFVSLLAVAVQQGLMLFIVFLSHGHQGLMALDYTRLVWQLALGGLLIAPGVWWLGLVRQNTMVMARQLGREFIKRYRD